MGAHQGDGPVRPLALGLYSQVGPHLLKSDLQLPAKHKPFQDLGRVRCRAGAQQGLGSEGLLGVADQHPANDRRGLAGAVPDRRLGGDFHHAGGAVVPGNRGTGPSYLGLVKDLGLVKEGFQRGTPWAFQRRAAVLTWLTGRRWRIEGRVQTQSGDEGDRFTEGLTAVEQVQHGIGVVAHQHQRALGEPAAQLQNHLPRPAGEFFVPASLLLAVPCR